jgi:hypothetical protein
MEIPPERDEMDPEVIDLCNALNDIPTLTTTESCCGHGTAPMRIFFRITDQSWLFVIGRCINRNYSNTQFRCLLNINDIPETSVGFFLESYDKGHDAYENASRFADEIYYWLARDDVLDIFVPSGQPTSAVPLG